MQRVQVKDVVEGSIYSTKTAWGRGYGDRDPLNVQELLPGQPTSCGTTCSSNTRAPAWHSCRPGGREPSKYRCSQWRTSSQTMWLWLSLAPRGPVTVDCASMFRHACPAATSHRGTPAVNIAVCCCCCCCCCYCLHIINHPGLSTIPSASFCLNLSVQIQHLTRPISGHRLT